MSSSLRPAGSTTRWRRIRAYVLRRDNYRCWICGRTGADSVDHRTPRRLGGTDDLTNLAAAHLQCNLRKGARVLPGTTSDSQPTTSREW